MYYPSQEQKRLAEEQIRGIALGEMRKRGFFFRVEPLTAGTPVKEGDYVLEEVDSKKVDKFLRELGKASRKIVKKKANYELERLVDQAAEKAKLPAHHGKDLAVRFLQMGAGE